MQSSPVQLLLPPLLLLLLLLEEKKEEKEEEEAQCLERLEKSPHPEQTQQEQPASTDQSTPRLTHVDGAPLKFWSWVSGPLIQPQPGAGGSS